MLPGDRRQWELRVRRVTTLTEPWTSNWCRRSHLEDHRACPQYKSGAKCACTKQGCPCAHDSVAVAARTPAVVTEPTPRLIELPDLIQGSDEWLDQRRGMLTASVIGQLITSRTLTAIEFECPDCGASAYSTCVSKRDSKPIATLHPARAAAARDDDSPPILEPAKNDDSRALTLNLVAERITGRTERTFINADMWRGIEEEPRAVEKYAEHYAPVTTTGFLIREWDGLKLGYSPDGLVGADGLLEVKCPRAKTHIQTILADEVPARHMAQIQCGLLVSGREWLDFISFCGGLPMWTKRVLPDPRWAEAIVAAAQAFERTAEQMVTKYEAAVTGLPKTERVELELVI